MLLLLFFFARAEISIQLLHIASGWVCVGKKRLNLREPSSKRHLCECIFKRGTNELILIVKESNKGRYRDAYALVISRGAKDNKAVGFFVVPRDELEGFSEMILKGIFHVLPDMKVDVIYVFRPQPRVLFEVSLDFLRAYNGAAGIAHNLGIEPYFQRAKENLRIENLRQSRPLKLQVMSKLRSIASMFRAKGYFSDDFFAFNFVSRGEDFRRILLEQIRREAHRPILRIISSPLDIVPSLALYRKGWIAGAQQDEDEESARHFFYGIHNFVGIEFDAHPYASNRPFDKFCDAV